MRSGRNVAAAVLAGFGAALVLANGLSAQTETSPSPAPGSATGFVDEFDQLDTERWYLSDGWVNGDHQNCLWSKDRITLENGALRLSLTDDPAQEQAFTCAELQSNARFGFGTYEARMRIPFHSGVNAAFFTHVGAQQKSPHNEIDFEFLGRDGPTLQTNYFTDGKGGREQLHGQTDDGRFRNYALIWKPDLMQWYVDGRLLREVRGADVPQVPQKVYFSLWSSGTLTDWLGPFTYPGQPLRMDVDRFAFTPIGAKCAFDGSLACLEE